MENQEIKSIKINAGKRTYFLDVKESREGINYLVISESKLIDKNEYHHDRVMIFQEFFQTFFDAIVELAPEFGVNQIKFHK